MVLTCVNCNCVFSLMFYFYYFNLNHTLIKKSSFHKKKKQSINRLARKVYIMLVLVARVKLFNKQYDGDSQESIKINHKWAKLTNSHIVTLYMVPIKYFYLGDQWPYKKTFDDKIVKIDCKNGPLGTSRVRIVFFPSKYIYNIINNTKIKAVAKKVNLSSIVIALNTQYLHIQVRLPVTYNV